MSVTNYSIVKNKLGYFEVAPKPDAETLKEFYSKKYFQESVSSSYSANYSDIEKQWLDGAAIIAEHVSKKFSSLSTGNLCDVGCGEGFFSGYLLRKGWKVTALDFSEHGVKSQNPDVLPYLKTGDIYETLEQTINENKKFDLINLSNVLEHVLEPAELLTKLKKLMHEKSLLRVMVPNDYSAFQKFLVDNKMTTETWFIPPEHLTYFTVDSLRALTNSLGFKTQLAITSFPIEFYLVNSHSNYWQDRSLGKQAHLSRIKVDNFLLNQSVEDYITYYEAAAKVGIGRDITVYLSVH